MGRFIALMVGAVVLAASYLVFSGQRTSLEAREQQSKYQYLGIANDVAQSGFNRGLSAIQRDRMAVTDSFGVAVGEGEYDVHITKNLYGDLDVDVAATSGGAAYNVLGNVIFTAPMPAALMVEDEEVVVSGSGTYQISGVDRRMPSRGTGASFQDPARGIMTTYSNMGAFTSGLSLTDIVGIGDSPGDPVHTGSIDGGMTFAEPALEALYQDARSNATTTISGLIGTLLREPMLQSAVNGSGPGDPRVIRVVGDLTITQSLQGYGLLLVEDGDLNVVAPSFEWEGLILVRKALEDTVSVSLQNTTVHGAVIAYDHDPGTALAECVPDFDVLGDHAIVNEPFRVRVKVLGSAIVSGDYDMPVTARVDMGGTIYEPWGDYDLPLDGNINTGNSGVTYSWEPDVIFPAGTTVIVDARSWAKNDGQDGDQNSEWHVNMERNSASDDQQLQVLGDGAPVPGVAGFQGQYSVEEFMADYLLSGHVALTANQVVNLFELGETNTSSEAFDMQDAVVLVTMVRSGAAACEAGGSASRLLFSVKNGTQIHYSSEAIAKLGLRLSEISEGTDVRMTRSVVQGQGKGETLAFAQSVEADDQEFENETGGEGELMSVCHKPEAGGGGGTTRSISESLLGLHIAHGDYVGSCN